MSSKTPPSQSQYQKTNRHSSRDCADTLKISAREKCGLVRLLLAYHADINATAGKNGWTALHLAAAIGKRDVVELLLLKGADVNTRDQNRWTPLHVATANDQKEVVELLLAKGADVNAKDKTL